MNAPATVLEFLARQQLDQPHQPALLAYRQGAFAAETFAEIAEQVEQASAALTVWGVESGERVAILAENRPEWLIADLALQASGAVVVPIQTALSAAQVAAQIEHCGVTRAIVSAEFLPKLTDAALRLLRQVVILGESGASGDAENLPSLTTWPGLLKGAAQPPQRLSAIVARTHPDQLATIIYTSGTAGEPKGVMLTHGNLAFDAWATWTAFGNPPSERRFSMLPWSHAFARTCDLYAWLASGTQLIVGRSRETLFADLKATQPTYLNSVPHFFQKVQQTIATQNLADMPGAARTLLGGALRAGCSGGAPLPREVFEFYQRQGVSILEGYGLTEGSPVVATCTETAFRPGSVGQPLPGVEVTIAADGEILTRGPHTMAGYYRDERATAAVLRNGWLHTGDLGRVDADGYLYVTGRKKDLLVLSSGLKVSPASIESLLTQDPLIEQAFVVGDGRRHLAALIVPAASALGESLHDRIAQSLVQRLKDTAPHEQIRRFTLLARPFTLEAGELTAKLSLRRDVIAQRYAAEIEKLYTC